MPKATSQALKKGDRVSVTNARGSRSFGVIRRPPAVAAMGWGGGAWAEIKLDDGRVIKARPGSITPA